MPEAVDASDHDQDGDHRDERGIGQGRQDGGPMIAEGTLGVRGPQCQPDSHHRKRKRAHIREVVPGVGQKTRRARHQSEEDLGDDQPGIHGQADGESSGSSHKDFLDDDPTWERVADSLPTCAPGSPRYAAKGC